MRITVNKKDKHHKLFLRDCKQAEDKCSWLRWKKLGPRCSECEYNHSSMVAFKKDYSENIDVMS